MIALLIAVGGNTLAFRSNLNQSICTFFPNLTILFEEHAVVKPRCNSNDIFDGYLNWYSWVRV